MPYKDKTKQREAVRLAVRKHRVLHHRVLPNTVIPNKAATWRGAVEAHQPHKLEVEGSNPSAATRIDADGHPMPNYW